MRIFLIKNSTSTQIDLSKSNPKITSLSPGETTTLRMSLISYWHGHAASGSFAIYKNYDEIEFLCWGIFNLNLIHDGDFTIVEIVEKSIASE